jgi:EAL domain-containing protein (putative c-di-GMP-specific phosphodiesterase class I)/GGDEF domain-containing protein
MQGWTQLGELKLSLHPGFAYSGLYKTLTSTIQWFAILLAISITILWLVLHYLLSPLKKVKEQADAIHRNQFVQQEVLPATSELKSVVEAMNRMVSKVQAAFNEQEKTLSRYQALLYRDKLTGLGNRRYLLENLDRSLAEDSSFHGCLVIVKLVNFDLIHEQQGYQVSAQLAKDTALLIVEPYIGISAHNVSKLSDDEFAFLIPADELNATEFISAFYHQFKLHCKSSEMMDDLFLVSGISPLSTKLSSGEILSNIDYSLTQAANNGPYAIVQTVSSDLTLPRGRMQWRTWLEETIEGERLFLVGQYALANNKNKLQKELFVRARNAQNEVLPASAFMPMATSLGMAQEIDRIVFNLVRENIGIGQESPLAINLSMAFFERADNHEELEQLMIDSHENGAQLCIEASHQVLIHHPVMCKQLSDRCHQSGHFFGADNLDLGQSLQLLQLTSFDYVKIAASTLQDMNSEAQSEGFQALKAMIDTLDIKMIAVGVDSQLLFDELQSMGIEFMQGNFLNEPTPL